MNWLQKISMGLWEDIEEAGPRKQHRDIDERMNEFNRRRDFTQNFGWSVPTKEVIDKLQQFVGNDKILEVGAGKGLWAKLMQDAGMSLTPTDLHSGGDNSYYGGSDSFTQITQMDAEEAVLSFSDHTVLFLNWPPYDSPMAANALKKFSGNKLIYIGEGPGGCTANDEFCQMLYKSWQHVDSACVPHPESSWGNEIEIPQWEGLHDCISLYVRK